MLSVIILSGSGLVGALLCHWLRIPAGVLIGTILGVSGGSAILGFPHLMVPKEATQTLQIMIGLLVGSQISRSSLASGARSLIPAFLITAIMILTGVISALVVVRLTTVDSVTAFFAAAPGGIAQMSIIGASLGADGAAVAAVHLARLLLANACVVLAFAYFNRGGGGRPAPVSPVQSEAHPTKEVELEGAKATKRFVAMMLVGVAGGIAGLATPVPAGGVIGALFSSAAVRLLKPAPIPFSGGHLAVQALGGGVIGLGVTSDFLDKFAGLAAAGSIIVFAHVLVWLATFYPLAKLFRFDIMTSAFASAPGGMVEAISSAARTEASTIIVAFVHLVRLSATIAVAPSLIVFILTN